MAGERPCVFCDRSMFEERLIAEDDNFNYIATLGQITDGGYVLIVPKRHVSCVGAMTSSEIEEMATEATRLDAYITAEYKLNYGTVIFEHGIVGQTVKHAHLHLVPAMSMLYGRIKKDFPQCEFQIIESLDELRFEYERRQKPYLFWNDSDKQSVVCWDPPAPLLYLRIVIADELKRPERANWREMDPVLDKQFWSETVIRLKKYF